jgi:TRAP-type C4-dicarboxylate transport system permease large subunit
MVAIVALHIVLGTVTEELSIILLTIPIFFPVVMALDFGMPKESLAIWFGILILMVVSFGMLVPPMGLNVYVVNGMAPGVPLSESFRGVLPFLVSDFIRIGLILAFPGIALWLVKFMT